MASSTGPEPVSMETYWKRRVFVMAGLFAVLALVAYACSGPSDTGKRAAGVDGSGDDNVSASPTPSPSKKPSPSPDPSASPSKSPSGSPGPDGGEPGGGEGAEAGDGASGEPGGAGGIAAPKKPEDPCRPADVVVTMKVDKTDYAWDQKPKVALTVTNTAKQTCTVDVGPKGMEVRIASGDDGVFSTAHCAKGAKAAERKQLRRGEPVFKTVEWNRKRSWSDCRDKDVNANRPGTYVATLHGDYSGGTGTKVFRLN
ncbi:hypothetical protein CLV63_1215 [Murinocardiopsis flavida]|uniref:DUF4232 domain-containing protein n=1 Tax=Murinocardiopsis flavida TaxID=645275 RepID=A0A2P8D0Y6_9ACTN|nr:hypothetical protein [Murinocardiopsis flavida]PSK90880.1 hypothetical protein CLV63_1215 [Murinocardiopsis flavida]